MSQVNINVDEEFLKKLNQLMIYWSCKNKSETIRTAVDNCLERELRKPSQTDFNSWIGLGSVGDNNPSPMFSSHEALWNLKNGR